MTGDKSMPALPLKQPWFTYCACGPFTKHREKIQKFRETAHLKHLYKNELDIGWLVFSWYTYSGGKDLAKRTISGKILRDRAYQTARNRNYDAYQRELASSVYKFFDKKQDREKM